MRMNKATQNCVDLIYENKLTVNVMIWLYPMRAPVDCV
jgi:hypothetical protein